MSEKLVAIVQKKGSEKLEVITNISVFVIRDEVLIILQDGKDGKVENLISIPMEEVFSIGMVS